MAMTLRLPEGLAERGRRYAAESGISLNGLLAVALREYLDVRKPEPRMPPATASAGAGDSAASQSRASRPAREMKQEFATEADVACMTGPASTPPWQTGTKTTSS